MFLDSVENILCLILKNNLFLILMNVEEKQFKDFAELLFNKECPPPPRSIAVDIEYEDGRSQCSDFLFDLFIYGFRKKIDTHLTALGEEKFFNFIRDYIRALGFDVILYDYERDVNGDISNINVGFQPL